MSRRLFDKKTKEQIYRQMEKFGGEITQEDVLAIISPYLEADIDTFALRNQYKKRVANSVMARFKDSKGIRTCFNIHEGNESKYINIDITKNEKHLEIIDTMCQKKIEAYSVTQMKANKNRSMLKGQISMQDIGTDQ